MSRTYREMHRHAQVAARERRRARLFTQRERARFMRAALTLLRSAGAAFLARVADPRSYYGKAGW